MDGWLYLLGGLMALVLLAYLFLALMKSEWFE